jgi:alkyl hydroperoxide reductase subunit AhpC
MAETQKEEIGPPILGQKAPGFEVVTTQGVLRPSDFQGTWLVLFSHPADFTPVCKTEFIAFSEIYDELKKRNVELLGLSVDNVSSHIAWIRNVGEKMGVKIPFPIIADLNKEVAKKYGMMNPEQSKTETFSRAAENANTSIYAEDAGQGPMHTSTTYRVQTLDAASTRNIGRR